MFAPMSEVFQMAIVSATSHNFPGSTKYLSFNSTPSCGVAPWSFVPLGRQSPPPLLVGGPESGMWIDQGVEQNHSQRF